MSISIDFPRRTATHVPQFPTSTRLVAAGPALWRVVDANGLVMGHLQEIATDAGTRFRARRYHAPSRTFRDVGDFWSREQAIECLRVAR